MSKSIVGRETRDALERPLFREDCRWQWPPDEYCLWYPQRFGMSLMGGRFLAQPSSSPSALPGFLAAFEMKRECLERIW
jgi:hypothetical protein